MPGPPSNCCVSACRMGFNRCHLVPSNQREWFNLNGMAEYAINPANGIDDDANQVTLRADIHLAFDRRRFAIVPKPSSKLPSSGFKSVSNSDAVIGSHCGSYGLVVHVLGDGGESDELVPVYHNIAIQPESANAAGREFLFARFAWSLFPLLQLFLVTSTRRRLAIIAKGGQHASSLSSALPSEPQLRYMNDQEWMQHLYQRGESRSGSKKRSSSQLGRDEADFENDAYHERWERRSHSMDSANSHRLPMDPVQRQLDEATRWYDEHGRFTAVDSPPDYWEDGDMDLHRGRPRNKRYRDGDVDAVGDGQSHNHAP